MHETNGNPLLLECDVAYVVALHDGKLLLNGQRRGLKCGDEFMISEKRNLPNPAVIGVLCYGRVGEGNSQSPGSYKAQFMPSGPNAFSFSKEDTNAPNAKNMPGKYSQPAIYVVNGQVFFNLNQPITLKAEKTLWKKSCSR
jgi:hypothetical protein